MSNSRLLPIDRTGIEKSEHEFAQRSWQPVLYAKQFQVNFGIYGIGLFSGISKAETKVISETEAGVAKERREKKKRTIEYKD